MISDRQVFNKAKEIIYYLGQTIPVTQIDPFAESQKVALLHNDLKIEWSRILASDDFNHIHVAETIEIYAEELVNFTTEKRHVFHALKTDKSTIETFKYIPGDWVGAITQVSNDIRIKNNL